MGWRVFVLIFGIAVSIWLIKPPLISAYISDKVKVPVTARMVSIWPTRTKLHYFSIRNPHGYKGRAFKAEKVEIDYEYHKVTGIPSEIDQIVVSNAVLNIEIRDRKDNNWAKIGSQIHERERTREAIVHKLIINNMTVNTMGKGAVSLGVVGTQHFDQMEFDEIDSAKGFPTREILGKIFGKAGISEYVQELVNPAERLDNTISPFNIFGKITPEGSSGVSDH